MAQPRGQRLLPFQRYVLLHLFLSNPLVWPLKQWTMQQDILAVIFESSCSILLLFYLKDLAWIYSRVAHQWQLFIIHCLAEIYVNISMSCHFLDTLQQQNVGWPLSIFTKDWIRLDLILLQHSIFLLQPILFNSTISKMYPPYKKNRKIL